MAKNAKVYCKVIEVIIKQSKNHLLRKRPDLQGILPPYASEKDDFPLIVLPMVEAFS